MLSSDERISMANVFTAEDDQILRDVSVETMTPGTTATFKVYLLGDDDKKPHGRTARGDRLQDLRIRRLPPRQPE